MSAPEQALDYLGRERVREKKESPVRVHARVGVEAQVERTKASEHAKGTPARHLVQLSAQGALQENLNVGVDEAALDADVASGDHEDEKCGREEAIRREERGPDKAGVTSGEGLLPDAGGGVLPHGWSAHVDTQRGLVYYFNAYTGEARWEPPAIEEVEDEQVRQAGLFALCLLGSQMKVAPDTGLWCHGRSPDSMQTHEQDIELAEDWEQHMYQEERKRQVLEGNATVSLSHL
jgi:hypothetical protein